MILYKPLLSPDEIAFIQELSARPATESTPPKCSQLDRWALIIEDDGMVRSELASAISRMGILCWHAGNLAEARRRMLEEPPPSIVFLDLRLPDGNGMELLKDEGFQRWRRRNATQVVVITGHGSAQLAEEASGRGAFAFLRKPVSLRQLKEITQLSLVRQDYENLQGQGK
ncbi:hypothetical protein CKO35_09730 [Ectothiorhodospira shaposhnikovii]|uniref:response regulator n=1 Tax=Ectothiorhodospira shaposhnikovii TaxID=1054 RepID=UPI001905D9A8|nr:response regulator [Ectothiorhodospira shaposhnikovii]MBK1673581.1 hypothetical protein [Ectothiorhodospira shaposhnikovii]